MNHKTNLLETHLQLLNEMVPNQTDDFFYTRLKGRMEQELQEERFIFNLRPAKLIGGLSLLLILNFTIAFKQVKNNESYSKYDFAKNYGITLDSPY